MATSFHSPSNQPSDQWNRAKHQMYSIFVGNISYATSEKDLRLFFENTCGMVDAVQLICDNRTGQSRGFGFVQFSISSAYETALKLNGSSLNRRRLKISPNRSNFTPTRAEHIIRSTEPAPTSTAVEQKTSVVHCKKENYDVYIGRPSIWGNPFIIGRDGDKATRIAKYRHWIMTQPELIVRAKNELRGRILGCWCKPEACHGDILAEIIDKD